MSERHLGDRLHDLLDHRLSPESAAEAMAHLEGCAECTARWNGLRAAREALNSSEAGIDLRFTSRLLDRDRMAEIAKAEDPRHVRAARPRDRRPMVLTTSLSLMLAALVGAAYAAGEPEDVDPDLTASSANGTALSVASMDSQGMRAGQQLAEWVQPDWEATGLTPVEASLVRADSGATVLVATLLSGSQPVLLTEQQGHLPEDYVADKPQVSVGGIDAYVIGSSPSQLVWQAGEVVVSLTCTCAVSTLEEVAGTFPTDGEPGFVDQVMTGFGVFADALSGN